MEDPRRDARAAFEPVVSADAARYLERELFNACVERATTLGIEPRWSVRAFAVLYGQRVKTLMHHVRAWANADAGTDPRTWAKRFVSANAKELDPEVWAETETRAREGMERCRKCRSLRTTYRALQTRSSDEPMTLFFRCADCQHRWKA